MMHTPSAQESQNSGDRRALRGSPALPLLVVGLSSLDSSLLVTWPEPLPSHGESTSTIKDIWDYRSRSQPLCNFFPFSKDFPPFPWVFGKRKRSRHGRHLSPGTRGCLLPATHQQPVAGITGLSHPSWTSLAGRQALVPLCPSGKGLKV